MDERETAVSTILRHAAETHHVVYAISDGADEDWASWYAEWLISLSELPKVLGATPVRSHLVHQLVQLEQAHDPAAGRWEDVYAASIVARFGAAASS